MAAVQFRGGGADWFEGGQTSETRGGVAPPQKVERGLYIALMNAQFEIFPPERPSDRRGGERGGVGINIFPALYETDGKIWKKRTSCYFF